MAGDEYERYGGVYVCDGAQSVGVLLFSIIGLLVYILAFLDFALRRGGYEYVYKCVIRVRIHAYVWACVRYRESLNVVVGTITLHMMMVVVMVTVIGDIVGDDYKGDIVGDGSAGGCVDPDRSDDRGGYVGDDGDGGNNGDG